MIERIFDRDYTYVIAEIGGNFKSVNTAKLLIDDAKKAGVDAIKLQTFSAKTLVCGNAMFDMQNTGVVSQAEYFKEYELDEDSHAEIIGYARNKGLDIFSTPSHISDVNMLEKYEPDVYKIGADDATNIPFLKKVAKLGKPILLSSGMCTLQEVKEAVNAILEEGNKDIVVMHVVSLYPTEPQFVNLNVIDRFISEFPGFVVGYSDHTMSTDACLFAAVKGASVIEKHFTYDKKADGPDHMHSATSDEMKELVDKIRLYEKMRGDGIKRPIGDELKNRQNNRKSIVSIQKIKKGELLTEENIDIKRPGCGLSPKFLPMILGKRAMKDIDEDCLLDWSDIG